MDGNAAGGKLKEREVCRKMQRYYASHLMEDEEMRRIGETLRIGVESIEFSISDNLDHLGERLSAYRKRWEQMGRPELTVHGPFLDLNPMSFDRMVRDATRVRYEQAYFAARELGASKIVFHTGFLPAVNFIEGWAERMIEFYQEFLEKKPEDLQILIENVLDPFPEPLKQVTEAVEHPAFGICFDMGHAHCYSKVPCMEWMRVLETKIRHLHIHDNDGDRDSHLALGDGTLPVKALAEWIRKHPEVTGTFECRSEADVRKSLELLKALNGDA